MMYTAHLIFYMWDKVGLQENKYGFANQGKIGHGRPNTYERRPPMHTLHSGTSWRGWVYNRGKGG